MFLMSLILKNPAYNRPSAVFLLFMSRCRNKPTRFLLPYERETASKRLKAIPKSGEISVLRLKYVRSRASEERKPVTAVFLDSVQRGIRILINACAGVFTVRKRYTHTQSDSRDIPIRLRQFLTNGVQLCA